MGGSSSTLNLAHIKLTEKECHTVMKELYERQVFDALADSDGMISLEALNSYYSKRFDVFLTHDWGKELGVDNHERVSRVNEAMKKRGLLTWFDSEKMEGNVKKKMISGIENSNCIIVFVTKRYMDKVDSDNAEDNCQLEFNYASRRKTARKMVPVVMEARMRDTSSWVGEVGMVLGGSLYVDLATDDSFEARMDEIYSRVLGVTGTSLKKVMENNKDLMELVQAKAHDAAHIAAASATAATSASPEKTDHEAPPAAHGKLSAKEQAMVEAIQNWIMENTDIVPNFASKYATSLVSAGVGSVDKLKKKLVKNTHYLEDIGVDEYDAEEIALVALGRKSNKPEEEKPKERDFKELQDWFMSACWIGDSGRAELEAAAADRKDIERSMLAKGYLACAWERGEGQFEKDSEKSNGYGTEVYDWLMAHSLSPTDDFIPASSVEPKPYGLSVLAATLLAYMLRDSIGVEEDAEMSVRYTKAAVPYGNLIAQCMLAYALTTGAGVEEDDEKGVQFYRLAAAQSHPVALNNLAVHYANGEGVLQDDAEAARFYKRAADTGYRSAVRQYGECLYFGTGVVADAYESFKYLYKAYLKGDHEVCYLLAFCYRDGNGVGQDNSKAREMMRLAVEAGSDRASDAWDRFRNL